MRTVYQHVYGGKVGALVFVSETACFGTIEIEDTWNKRMRTRRISKKDVFDTFDEAKSALIAKWARNLSDAQVRVRNAEAKLAIARAQTEADHA